MIKDKGYSIRLNKQLVDKVKAEHGLAPQAIIDKAYKKYYKLWKASEDPERAVRGRPFGAKTVRKLDEDIGDL